MRLARGQQLILRCGGTDAARQDTPPEPVKEFEAGHSRDLSNIRLLFACRRARRVRSRLPPPPPSPGDDRAPGSLGDGPEFPLGFQAISAVAGELPGEARPGRCEVVAGVPVIVSRARFGGPGLRGPCTTDPCQSSGPRNVEFRYGSRVVPEYPASKLLASRRPSPTSQKLTMTRGARGPAPAGATWRPGAGLGVSR